MQKGIDSPLNQINQANNNQPEFRLHDIALDRPSFRSSPGGRAQGYDICPTIRVKHNEKPFDVS